MKRIFMSLALLFVVALTATATGYASEADTGYQPPTVIQMVQADMPAVQEYAFLGWDAGMAVTYADQQVCPNIVLQPVAGECPNDLWEWRCMAITDGHLNQGSFCRSVVAPVGPMLKFSPLYADMSVEKSLRQNCLRDFLYSFGIRNYWCPANDTKHVRST